MTGLEFLKAVGQISSDTRQEFILLSDTLGLSTLVESINHPKPKGATQGTVLGPFHTHDAPSLPAGASITSHFDTPDANPLLVIATLKDLQGNPIPGATIDVWETDHTGHYDTQYSTRPSTGPDNRGLLTSSETGEFWFKAIIPVSYPIPHDGPVGKMLEALRRHPFRPAHMHFLISKEGWDTLVTSLYIKGDKYETSDAVFGVKSGLVVEVGELEEGEGARYGVEEGTKVIRFPFVMVGEEEARSVRDKLAKEALEKLGSTATLVEGLPVADVD